MPLARQPFDGSDVNIQHILGPTGIVCPNCAAKHERITNSSQQNPRYTMCCAQGKVKLPLLSPLPQPLRGLFEDQTHKAKEFREHIRAYNNCFAFTSVGANIDQRLTHAGIENCTIKLAVYWKCTITPQNMHSYTSRIHRHNFIIAWRISRI